MQTDAYGKYSDCRDWPFGPVQRGYGLYKRAYCCCVRTSCSVVTYKHSSVSIYTIFFLFPSLPLQRAGPVVGREEQGQRVGRLGGGHVRHDSRGGAASASQVRSRIAHPPVVFCYMNCVNTIFRSRRISFCSRLASLCRLFLITVRLMHEDRKTDAWRFLSPH